MQRIKAELSADPQRGPGHGLIRITGAAPGADISFRIESNRRGKEHLQADGSWGNSQVMQSAHAAPGEDGSLLLAVGPTVVDPLVAGQDMTFRLVLSVDGLDHLGTLGRKGRLLGSGAGGDGTPGGMQRVTAPPPDAPWPEPAPEPEPEPAPEPEPEPEPVRLPDPAPLPEARAGDGMDLPEPAPASGMWLYIVLGVLALMLVGGAAGAWYFCLIPGLSGPSCATSGVAGTDEVAPGPADKPELSPAAEPADGSLLARARAMEASGDLVAARDLYQRAAREGEFEAAKRLARMYDPATWTRDSSPEPEPDWETANFWWEQATGRGDAEALRRAGYNMAKYGFLDIERQKGIEYLERAVEAGDSEAEALLDELRN